jgi:hypothetical protein
MQFREGGVIPAARTRRLDPAHYELRAPHPARAPVAA